MQLKLLAGAAEDINYAVENIHIVNSDLLVSTDLDIAIKAVENMNVLAVLLHPFDPFFPKLW